MESSRADSFLQLIHRARRGRLKIYLGYGPGVGKTYQMLLEGQRLKSRGVEVVIGIVESHGRPDTDSLTLGLESVSRRIQTHRGVRLEEMDVPAILERKPEVVLVDELAHTNVPGSRHTKRFEDVLQILSSGIHVITTLNIQHLESLYDTIARLTGVRVTERLPDWVIAEADEIVNVDLTTEDLQRRLEEGKVYPADRVTQAMTHFFRKENLDQLRELALREAASFVERVGRSPAETAAVQAPDQVLVCLSSRSPVAEALLRYASRLAGRLDRSWYALYVQTPRESPMRIEAATQRRLADTLALAQQLGGMVFTYKGDDVVETILKFSREYHVGHVVLGRPRALSAIDRLLGRKTVVEGLIAASRGLSVIVADVDGAPAATVAAPPEVQPPSHTSPEAGAARFADLLSPERIILFDRPVTKPVALAALVTAMVAPGKRAPGALPDREELLRRVLRREEEGSTFLSEGIAVPHVRLPHLAGPLVAMGLTRAGLEGNGAGAEQEWIILFAFPESMPKASLQLLAETTRLFRDGSLRDVLRSAPTPDAVLRAIRDHAGNASPNPGA